MKMTRRGPRFPRYRRRSLRATHFFSSLLREPGRMSIYPSNITQLQKIPNVVNRTHRRYIRVDPRAKSRKFEKQYNTWSWCAPLFRAQRAIWSNIVAAAFDGRRCDAFNDSDRSADSDNLIVTVVCRLLHKMIVSSWLIARSAAARYIHTPYAVARGSKRISLKCPERQSGRATPPLYLSVHLTGYPNDC